MGRHPPAQASPPPSRPLAWILAFGLGGYPYYEGQAELLAPLPEKENLWLVRFPGSEPCERFVFPEFGEPTVALPILRTYWRIALPPHIADEIESLMSAKKD